MTILCIKKKSDWPAIQYTTWCGRKDVDGHIPAYPSIDVALAEEKYLCESCLEAVIKEIQLLIPE